MSTSVENFLKNGNIGIEGNGTIGSQIVAIANTDGKKEMLTRQKIRSLLVKKFEKTVKNIQQIKNYCDGLIENHKIAFDYNPNNKVQWHYYSMKSATEELKLKMLEQLETKPWQNHQ